MQRNSAIPKNHVSLLTYHRPLTVSAVFLRTSNRCMIYRFRRNMRLTASAKHRNASKMRQSKRSFTDGMLAEEGVMCQCMIVQ